MQNLDPLAQEAFSQSGFYQFVGLISTLDPQASPHSGLEYCEVGQEPWSATRARQQMSRQQSLYYVFANRFRQIKLVMSKAKGKQKKGQNLSAQHQLIQQQKRQLLQQAFTIRRLQDRLSRMTEENHQISSQRDKVQQSYEERIDKQRIIIESHENNIKENRGKIYQLEVSKMTLQNRIKDLERQIRDQEIFKNREFEEYKRVTQNEIAKLQLQLKEYNIYMGQREGMNTDNSHLKNTLEAQREERIREVADKQRQKVQAIDRLRDEMLNKIKDMRSNLLSLKKEQLDTTTRLAVLQNHQLTTELEFQSKQSQKLVFQNEQLIKKLSHLQKDLQIHKQIEEELAKRSHYSRGIIKKLTAKIAELEESLKQAQTVQIHKETPQRVSQSEQISKEDVIRTLDRSLENSQKKFLKLQSENEVTRNEISLLRSKLQQFEKKTNGLWQILFKAYGEFQDGSLSTTSGGYQVDLGSVRKKSVEIWSKQELRLVINALLQQANSFLNRKNLHIPMSIKPEEVSVLDSDDVINNVRLPKLSEHSTSKLELSMKLKELPVSIGSKLVGSHVRDWGRTVHSSSHVNLARKFKVYDK